jgi:serine/threonine-protein kinase HipA
MITVARVNIWNFLVGAVAWDDDRGYASFEYDSAFLKRGLDLSPLRMSAEEARNGNGIFSFSSLNKETYKGLPGLLADSLPDKFGNKLIEAWLAQQGRDANSLNPIERLCYTGRRGMGALEYEPAIHSVEDKSDSIEIKELVRLSKEILSERKKLQANIHKKSDKGLLEIIRVGTSAGGARAKAIIAYNPETGDVRSGQIDELKGYEYWMIKFDGVSDKEITTPKGYGKIEYAYYLMAKDCGINMSQSKLLHENKRAHFMTKRFDRENTKKLHMQTLCALAHFDYNEPGAYSYEQAFQVMRQLKLPYSEMEELYRRMAFNVIARNQDDHTKNISFLMDDSGKWKLSPAYDMTYAYDPKSKWMRAHQLRINGKSEDISSSDLQQLAKKMNIKKSSEIIEQVKESASKWTKFAKEAEIHPDQIKAIKQTFLLNF